MREDGGEARDDDAAVPGDEPPLDTAPLKSPRGGRNLPVAIASGVILAALFLGTVAWNAYAFLTFIAVIVTIGLLEVANALRGEGLRPVTPVAVASGLVMLYGAHAVGPQAQALGLVLLVFGTLTWLLSDRHRDRVVASLGATFLMTLWVPFCASFVGLLLAREDGRWLVMAVVALTVSGDIGAYAFGRPFGRHKLAPTVSPGKTWEGVAGGLLTVLVLAASVTAPLVPSLDLVDALLLGAVCVAAGTLGDLSESLVKRDLGVKDLGTVLPGHGGIMDRVDAMILSLPAAHLILLALGI
jgi:phosphatidate cytidylyltransferase